MNQEEFLSTIAEALDLEAITMDGSQENIEEWDSLGHLSILSALDAKLGGEAAKLNELSKANSVKDLYNHLSKKNLIG